jgi:hypothetical protein
LRARSACNKHIGFRSLYSISETAAAERIDAVTWASQLTLLAPDIIELILDGRQPAGKGGKGTLRRRHCYRTHQEPLGLSGLRNMALRWAEDRHGAAKLQSGGGQGRDAGRYLPTSGQEARNLGSWLPKDETLYETQPDRG